MIELTRSYGKRSSQDNVASVLIVSERVIRVGSSLIDLRTGAESGKSRDLDSAYARDGRVLRRVGEQAHVVHRDGRSVPMELEDLAMRAPTFVGSALLVQDDRNHGRAFGVFDTATGALRGRIKHTKDPEQPDVVSGVPVDGKDGRHVWFSDITSLRSWNVETLTNDRTVKTPAKHVARGVGLMRSGNLVTSIRPVGQGSSQDELLVLTPRGEVVARRKQRHMSFAVAGSLLAVMDTEKNQLVCFDEQLGERAVVALPPKENFALLVELWSGLDEFLAIDGHGQIHHVADGSPRGARAARPPKTPAKKVAARKKR